MCSQDLSVRTVVSFSLLEVVVACKDSVFVAGRRYKEIDVFVKSNPGYRQGSAPFENCCFPFLCTSNSQQAQLGLEKSVESV